MSIRIENIASKFEGRGDDWENFTWITVLDDDDALRVLYEDAGYDVGYDARYDDVCYDQLNNNEEKRKYILGSMAVYEMELDYYPVLEHYAYILQREPTKEDVLKLYENAPNIVIIKDSMGKFFICTSRADRDFLEEVAYAYMVIDRSVPPEIEIDKDNSYSLSKEAHKELVGFMC